MHFDIRAQGFELTPALRQHAERRLTFALSRFDSHLVLVSVRLGDDNGPRGGIDKYCVVRAHLARMPDVFITERSDDLYAAIDLAADRAGRTVARRLERARGNGHELHPAAAG